MNLMSTPLALPKGVISGFAYTTLQELATRIAHRNTGLHSHDPVCDQLLARIAMDENLHMIFYRDLLHAAFDLAPNESMIAFTSVVANFQMPGHIMTGFRRKALQIATAGIYDLRIHHDHVLTPVLNHLKVFTRTDLTGAGAHARDELAQFLHHIDTTAQRFTERLNPHSATRPDQIQ